MMTTNHDHAVAAGVGDRRLVVYDVSEEHACDKAWFDPLYQDLDDGGRRSSCIFCKTSSWRLASARNSQDGRNHRATAHERRQRFAMVAGMRRRRCSCRGARRNEHDLGIKLPEILREAYTGYCKQQGVRAANG